MDSKFLPLIVLMLLLLVGCSKSSKQMALGRCEEWINEENPFAYQEDPERFEGDNYVGKIRFCKNENGLINGYEAGPDFFEPNVKNTYELKRSWVYN